jgi:hypothetical protein
MSSPSDESSGDRFQLDARAKGHADMRVVMQGNMYNYYVGDREGTDGLRPFDLPNLRLWIDRIVTDYGRLAAENPNSSTGKEAAGHLRELALLSQSVSSSPQKTKDRNALRRLLAGGIAQYLSRAGTIPDHKLPEQLLKDVAVFALWPILQATVLPSTWEEDLAEITSPRVASITAAARGMMVTGQSVDLEGFAGTLSAKPLERALFNLFEDLNDPRRGGSALTAIAVATGLPDPPRKGGAQATARWVITALVGTAAGITAYELGESASGILDRGPDPVEHIMNAWGGNQYSTRSHHHSVAEHVIDHLVDDIINLF